MYMPVGIGIDIEMQSIRKQKAETASVTERGKTNNVSVLRPFASCLLGHVSEFAASARIRDHSLRFLGRANDES